MSGTLRRLNPGSGSDIRSGYVNVDSARVPGVDVIAYLAVDRWPFSSDVFDEIQVINVLEHPPNTVAAVEEIYCVALHGGRVVVRIPYWSCWQVAADLTASAAVSPMRLRFIRSS